MPVEWESIRGEVLIQLKRATKRGLQAAAIEIAGEAKQWTPVDTGRLRASIAWAADGEQRLHQDSAEGRDGETTEVSFAVWAPEGQALVGTNVEYAPKVHEDMTAFHRIGQAKFIEQGFTNKEERVKELMRLAMEGKL